MNKLYHFYYYASKFLESIKLSYELNILVAYFCQYHWLKYIALVFVFLLLFFFFWGGGGRGYHGEIDKYLLLQHEKW